MNTLYYEYSKYLKQKYGQKIYKLPINLPITCPNRDGNISSGGCTFCADVGTGFESLENTLSVKEQLERNMEYIKRKYKAEKFIAYFQNYSNTYLELKKFKKYIKEAVIDNIVEISISTRPDCIRNDYLDFLEEIRQHYKIDISIELGLQTVNYHTLKKINRGHTLAEYIDAVNRIKQYKFEICTHLILNLPWDDIDDVIESAKIISALDIKHVKIHSLYIIKGTKLGDQYEKGQIKLIEKDEYIERVITFLEYLKSDIVIQRLMGRAPKEDTLFSNWNTSWWKVRDEIIEEMKRSNRYQGKEANYLNGKALKNKNY